MAYVKGRFAFAHKLPASLRTRFIPRSRSLFTSCSTQLVTTLGSGGRHHLGLHIRSPWCWPPSARPLDASASPSRRSWCIALLSTTAPHLT